MANGLTTGCSALNTENALPSQATMNTLMRLVMVSARAVLLVTVVSGWMTPDGYGYGPGDWQHNIPPTPSLVIYKCSWTLDIYIYIIKTTKLSIPFPSDANIVEMTMLRAMS